MSTNHGKHLDLTKSKYRQSLKDSIDVEYNLSKKFSRLNLAESNTFDLNLSQRVRAEVLEGARQYKPAIQKKAGLRAFAQHFILPTIEEGDEECSLTGKDDNRFMFFDVNKNLSKMMRRLSLADCKPSDLQLSRRIRAEVRRGARQYQPIFQKKSGLLAYARRFILPTIDEGNEEGSLTGNDDNRFMFFDVNKNLSTMMSRLSLADCKPSDLQLSRQIRAEVLRGARPYQPIFQKKSGLLAYARRFILPTIDEGNEEGSLTGKDDNRFMFFDVNKNLSTMMSRLSLEETSSNVLQLSAKALAKQRNRAQALLTSQLTTSTNSEQLNLREAVRQYLLKKRFAVDDKLSTKRSEGSVAENDNHERDRVRVEDQVERSNLPSESFF